VNADFELFIANANGTEIRQIINLGGGSGLAPAWSTDAKGVAFEAHFGGPSTVSIYRVDLDTGAITLLRTGAQQPNWAP
jgi:hypothetical protein